VLFTFYVMFRSVFFEDAGDVGSSYFACMNFAHCVLLSNLIVFGLLRTLCFVDLTDFYLIVLDISMIHR